MYIEKPYGLVNDALPDRDHLEKVYNSICMSPDGDWFAFINLVDSEGKPKSEIYLWDFESAKLRRSGTEHFKSLITIFCLRPESIYGYSRKICTLDSNALCQCWEIQTLEITDQFIWDCKSVTISPQYILSFGSWGVDLLDRKDNQSIRKFPNSIWAGFSPDHKRLITEQGNLPLYNTSPTGEYPSTNLWNSDDGRYIAELAGTGLQNWHFTPDSTFLLTEYEDGQIKIWSVEDGDPIFEISPGEDQVVTDISPDSYQFVTCSGEQRQTVKIWNIKTGNCFEIYQEKTTYENISTDCLSVDMDRVFSSSHESPKRLPRFNADGSSLITAPGLQSITTKDVPPERILSLIDAYLPIRLENGKIRSATTKEMLVAKLDYYIVEKGRQDPETISTILDIAVLEIDAGQIEKASEVLKDLQSLLLLQNNELDKRRLDILSQLSRKYRWRGDIHDRGCKYAEAIADYESSLNYEETDPCTLDKLAWLQAKFPETKSINSYKAIENAKKANELTGWTNWRYLSTYAVACAGSGKFADAVNYQNKAIDLLPPDKQDRWKANYEERLRLFQSGKLYDRKFFWNLPTDKMIAWWRFDQSEGSEAIDSSGNNLDGKLVGSAHFILDAERGYVLSIGIEGGYVDCGNDSSFNITGPITVVAWIKVQTFDKQWQAIITKGNFTWRLHRNSDEDSLKFNCNGLQNLDNFQVGVKGEISIDDGKWYHVVGVYDMEVQALYIDSVLDNFEKAQGNINSDTSPVWIGANAGVDEGLNREWNGYIDDVRVYNRALTSDEIRELYDATKQTQIIFSK